MTPVDIYGIKNCDTMKKAISWLTSNEVEFVFHDYKKCGADKNVISSAIKQHGWETVINRRGTTWRQLPDDIKNTMNDSNALNTALDNTSIIKRPLLVFQDDSHLGFKEEAYKTIFKR